MLISASARAHNLGLSRAEIQETSGGLHARCTFAAAEAEAAIDRDGHLALLLATDGAPCTPGAVTQSPDGDGVIFDEDFACARATTTIQAVEYFNIEDVMTLTTHEGVHQELLDTSHRAMTVNLHRPRTAHKSTSRTLIACASVAALALIGFAIRFILKRNS